MITEFLVAVVGNIAGWLSTLIPPNPDLDMLTAQMQSVFDPLEAGLNGLGAWIPWGVVNICATITLAFWLVTLVLRVVKSFLPTVSG